MSALSRASNRGALLYSQPMYPSYITEAALDNLIQHALHEDVGSGDVTTLATIPEETQAEAHFLAKADGILAGCMVTERVFTHIDAAVEVIWTLQDGAPLTSGTIFGTVRGAARSLLVGERLALNLMQRMSGIATATRQMVDAARPHRARILDTRKTAPGLRFLDKWAVKVGDGENHRIGLYDRILIKDNHITACGGIVPAIQAAQAYRAAHDPSLEIEVETRTLAEVEDVLATGGVEYLLLDNMVRLREDGIVDTSRLAEAVALVDGRIATEASGNVTLATVPAIASTGVDYISSGALTHSVTALDISLKIALQA